MEGVLRYAPTLLEASLVPATLATPLVLMQDYVEVSESWARLQFCIFVLLGSLVIEHQHKWCMKHNLHGHFSCFEIKREQYFILMSAEQVVNFPFQCCWFISLTLLNSYTCIFLSWLNIQIIYPCWNWWLVWLICLRYKWMSI